jgi:hypothetical protein
LVSRPIYGKLTEPMYNAIPTPAEPPIERRVVHPLRIPGLLFWGSVLTLAAASGANSGESRALKEAEVELSAERAQRLRDQIDAELQFEDEIRKRRLRNETAVSRDSLGAHAWRDLQSPEANSTARLAPSAPEIRDLPRGIFSEEPISIAPGAEGFANEHRLELTRLSLDADRDATPEIVRYVDRETDAWIRQDEDRNYDGSMDAFLRFDGGRLVGRNLDNNHDGRLDVFETYSAGLMATRSLDLDHDGVVDAYYTYEGRYLALERHDANNDGNIDLVIQYRAGRRVSSQEDTNRDGRTDTWIRYRLKDGFETISQIDIDRAGRGFADTFETFEARQGKAMLARRDQDLDGDGKIDLVSIYREGKLVRRNILKPEVVPL